jgi:hypothetical protein
MPTMKPLLAVLGAWVLMVALTPGVSAAKPERTVLVPPDPFVLPAGLGCAFDVFIEPHDDLRIMNFAFDDGRSVLIEQGTATISNVESGASFEHHPAFHEIDTVDASTNEIVVVSHGRVAIPFFPGDMGPNGVVSEPGLFLRFIGSTQARIDADTFVVTEFSFVGSYIDICAQIV